MRCSDKECRYEEVWVDNLRNFETWTIHWFTREITITKGVSGPGKDALTKHAESMRVGRWTKPCDKGCQCKGQWQKATVTPIPLRMGDGVYGAIAICTADLHKREYVGKCKGE
jgi:hypothetical protein